MSDVVHIITLPSRRKSIGQEMDRHGVTAIYWEGVTSGQPIHNINASHKAIVQHAKDSGMERIIIAEDDCRFFGEPGEGFKYFLDNRPTEPYDLYLSSFYSGDRLPGNRVKNIAGLTLYEVHSRFFDTYLSVRNDHHIDRLLSTTQGRFFVSPKFCTFQQKGYSYQRKRWADDSNRLIGQPIFGQ